MIDQQDCSSFNNGKYPVLGLYSILLYNQNVSSDVISFI